jgi:hypothetical protein
MNILEATKHQVEFEEYFEACCAESRKLGYVHPAVFRIDIEECYDFGCSVQQCVEEVF